MRVRIYCIKRMATDADCQRSVCGMCIDFIVEVTDCLPHLLWRDLTARMKRSPLRGGLRQSGLRRRGMACSLFEHGKPRVGNVERLGFGILVLQDLVLRKLVLRKTLRRQTTRKVLQCFESTNLREHGLASML